MTNYGLRLIDLYKLTGSYKNDEEVQIEVNKIVEDRTNLIFKEILGK